MTEPAFPTSSPRGPTPPRAPSATRRPSPLPTVAAALALFFVAFEFLASQLRSGNDPAIASSNPQRPVVYRKLLKTKVVTDVVPSPNGQARGTTVSGPATVSSTPAPASAPVVTSTS